MNKNRTKVLALYLPQFHQIPENDLWWGKGFTEWNVVKSAKKVGKDSNYPRYPLDGYYDLSKLDSIKRQADLATKYGIDGFVVYSYYSRGQVLLDKPLNLLKENTSIKIEYCLSWANHDWMRTWFSYDKEMLRKQEYAKNDDEIIEHFLYLLPFFKDSRYIKVDNKPLFFIYDGDFSGIEDYMRVWNNCAIENGFDGMFFVQTLGGRRLLWNQSLFNACFDFEPTYTTFLQMKKQHTLNKLKRGIKRVLKLKRVSNYFNYKRVCYLMKKRNETSNLHWLGCFAEWDNTPRHSYNGTVFTNFSIDTFKQQFKNQMIKSLDNNKNFLIVDAWNEWGEGAFLEPDSVYEYKKLEAIKDVLSELYKE